MDEISLGKEEEALKTLETNYMKRVEGRDRDRHKGKEARGDRWRCVPKPREGNR